MTTLEDVLAFICTASSQDLHQIENEMTDHGFEFTCDECENHECDECYHDEEMEDVRNDFIHRLVERNNQFGLDDMLDDLKREGERVGAFLKVGSDL